MLSNKLKILLTNDDGIEGKGLCVIAERLQSVFDVYVVAPDVNRSAVASHLTMNGPMRITECKKKLVCA